MQRSVKFTTLGLRACWSILIAYLALVSHRYLTTLEGEIKKGMMAIFWIS
jgi:hypothetical protein